MIQIQLKRVYDPVDATDGVRILVDRLWPRGFTKERLQADLWLKDLAPSPALIKRYHQHEISWQKFKTIYESELELQTNAIQELFEMANREIITLLFAARDRDQNQAIILRDYLLSMATSL